MSNMQKVWDDVYKNKDLPWTNNPIPEKVISKFIAMLTPNDKILDYGCGDGIFFSMFSDANLDVSACDISSGALEMAKSKAPDFNLFRCDTPNDVSGRFKGILVWGVFHHIPLEHWESYLIRFQQLLEDDGILLIGGHSQQSDDFKEGFRLSPTTGKKSYAAENLGDFFDKMGLAVQKEGIFPFVEAFTGINRSFKYYFLTKNSIKTFKKKINKG